MTIRQDVIKKVVGIEGGYSNHSSDRGGKTKYGITIKTARKHGYYGDMRNLSVVKAIRIYEESYWFKLRLDEIEIIDIKLAEELFDSGVNCGTVRTGKWLQRALNLFNYRGRHYQDLKVDGMIGRKTIGALRKLYIKRKQASHLMIRGVDSQQACHYFNFGERSEKQEDFMVGWFTHRVGNV